MSTVMRTAAVSEAPSVTVIGSGPAGLSSAARLQRRGATVTVLEKGEQVAQAWASRYDSLRFNTSRTTSAFAGLPFPREFGRFPTRDQYVRYLLDYQESEGISVRNGCTATRVDRDGAGWTVHTSTGPVRSQHVVIATGPFNEPWTPPWARSTGFTGEIVHAAAYHEPSPFVGRRVLVVGAGSTGLEIAHQLAHSGAAAVTLAVRTPPTIIFREFRGMAGDVGAPVLLRLPAAWADRLMRSMSRAMVGDLAPYGLPVPAEGPITQLKARGVGIAVVDPEVIDSLRDGLIRVRAAVTALEAQEAHLADGSRVAADAIILATGFTSGLRPLIGHLGVLDAQGFPLDGLGRELLPGLRCLGYVRRPGLTGYDSRLARRMARDLCPRRRAPAPARAASHSPA